MPVIPGGQPQVVTIQLQHVGEPLGMDFGKRDGYIVVERTKPGAAAERTGLQPPFIIHTIDGMVLTDEKQMISAVMAVKARNGMLIDMEIEPCHSDAGSAPSMGGGVGQDVVLALNSAGESLGLDFSREGDTIVVRRIKQGSAAERSGLVAPFIIRSLDGRPLHTEQDMMEAVKGVKARGGLDFPMRIDLLPPSQPQSARSFAPAGGGGVRRCSIHLQHAKERLGMSFRSEAGAVRVFEVSDAAARAGMPHGPNVVLRAIDGEPINAPEEVASVVGRIKAAGRLDFAIDVDVQGDASMPPSPAAPPPASPGAGPDDGVAIPAMPMFEPAHDPNAAMLLEKAKESGLLSGNATKFTFPADTAFWDNFCQQAQLNKTAQVPPIFQVTASHDRDKTVDVNQGFLRGFVGGWEEANPHTVTVHGPDGEKQFHCSKEFWAKVVEDLRRQQAGQPPPPPGEGVQIETDGHAPVFTSAKNWNNACLKWEQQKGITPAQRQEKLAQRWAEVDDEKQRRQDEEERQRRADEERARRAAEEARRQMELDRDAELRRLRDAGARRKASSAAAPPPPPRSAERRDQSTQWVDPSQLIFLRDFRPGPEQNCIPPFASSPPPAGWWDAPPPGCALCGALAVPCDAARLHCAAPVMAPPAGGSPCRTCRGRGWFPNHPPPPGCGPPALVGGGWGPDPDCASAAASMPLMYQSPPRQVGYQQQGYPYDPHGAAHASLHRARPAASPASPPRAAAAAPPGPAAAAHGDTKFWASFVKEWESVATDLQRASGPGYALDGVINMHDI